LREDGSGDSGDLARQRSGGADRGAWGRTKSVGISPVRSKSEAGRCMGKDKWRWWPALGRRQKGAFL
jgi:hypothetical protein